MLFSILNWLKPGKLISILTLSLAPLVAPASAVDLPDIGDTSRSVMSPEEERRLGEEFMRNVRQSLTIVDDPEVTEYIESLGYRLLSNVSNPEFQFDFFVVNAASINAFAGPGGHIGIHSGLFLTTESESELASVLAHEIAHVTQHHLARAIEDAKRTSIPTTAGLIAALILGSQNPQIGQAALAATAAGSIQRRINFTRANEGEADHLGMNLLVRAGFEPKSMAVFFERLQRATRLTNQDVPEFLRTHPVTHARIADARARADQLSAPAADDTSSLNYRLIRAKLRVLNAPDPNESITYFEEQLNKEQGEIAAQAYRYGHAQGLLAAGRYDAARDIIAQLLDENPNKIAYLIAQAETELGAGNNDAALQIFDEALKLYPRSHALTLYYAQALLQSDHPQRATELLRQHMRSRSPSPNLYKLLARAEGESGNRVEAHQSLAEYYYLSGQTRTAIEQLNIALELSKEKDDPFQTPRIKARLEQLKRLARDEESG